MPRPRSRSSTRARATPGPIRTGQTCSARARPTATCSRSTRTPAACTRPGPRTTTGPAPPARAPSSTSVGTGCGPTAEPRPTPPGCPSCPAWCAWTRSRRAPSTMPSASRSPSRTRPTCGPRAPGGGSQRSHPAAHGGTVPAAGRLRHLRVRSGGQGRPHGHEALRADRGRQRVELVLPGHQGPGLYSAPAAVRGGRCSSDALYFGNLLDHGYPGPATGLAISPHGYSILTRRERSTPSATPPTGGTCWTTATRAPRWRSPPRLELRP